MPGSKRKLDEDTWLIFQSKKSKTNQLSKSIYECTLAKLRHGSRSFFNPQASVGTAGSSDTIVSNISTGSSAFSSGNQHVRNATFTQQPPNNRQSDVVVVCNECQVNRYRTDMVTAMDKCNFCDKRACHLNSCKSCGEYFCYNCYIRRYDDPLMDTIVCIGCLP